LRLEALGQVRGKGLMIGMELVTDRESKAPYAPALQLFARLRDNAGVTIRGISNATLDRVGSVISEGLLDGESVDSIARNLAGVIDDPARAEMISHTETCRAQSLASVDLYQSEGFTRWTWILSDGACPKCVDQESRNPHAVGDEAPPLHPRCRCSVAPDPSSMTS